MVADTDWFKVQILDLKLHFKEVGKLSMPPKHKFVDGEKVLCYHGPLLYEAKVSFLNSTLKILQIIT